MRILLTTTSFQDTPGRHHDVLNQSGFEIVRHVAKGETPLVQMIANLNIINAVADVTLYGTDLVGNDVSATGSISIEFGNFGDH